MTTPRVTKSFATPFLFRAHPDDSESDLSVRKQQGLISIQRKNLVKRAPSAGERQHSAECLHVHNGDDNTLEVASISTPLPRDFKVQTALNKNSSLEKKGYI